MTASEPIENVLNFPWWCRIYLDTKQLFSSSTDLNQENLDSILDYMQNVRDEIPLVLWFDDFCEQDENDKFLLWCAKIVGEKKLAKVLLNIDNQTVIPKWLEEISGSICPDYFDSAYETKSYILHYLTKRLYSQVISNDTTT
eukprot:UN02412